MEPITLKPTATLIREIREAAGLTQREAAELVHLPTFQRWSEYERGLHAMSAATWELFCIKVGRHPAYQAVEAASAA